MKIHTLDVQKLSTIGLSKGNQVIAVNGTAFDSELLERAGDGPAIIDQIYASK